VPAPPAAPAAVPAPAPAAISAPAAEGITDHGLSFGLRVAVGFPLGNVAGQPPISANVEGATANSLGDEFALLFPVTLDAGYRLTRHWYLGAYFGFGFGTPPSACTDNSSVCEQNDLRFGVEAKYSTTTAAGLYPWIGAGLGWEIANQSMGTGGAGHADGPEFFHVRAGFDLKLGTHVFAGPEAMFTFATFTDNQSPSGTPIALHDWFTLGISGHYDL
jgi:hypothetical protein